jgi:hypothetical protein
MINTIRVNDFIDGIKSIRPDNFTTDALSEMFDWFEQYEEFDPIAICCDFRQSTLEEVNSDYSKEFADIGEAVEWINEESIVIAAGGDWIVYLQF